MSTPRPQPGNMIAQSLLPEFDQEMPNTRKTLERVPDGKFDWKPHEKSGTLGWMAAHLSTLPMWGEMTLNTDSLDVNPPGGSSFEMPKPTTRAEVVELFDKHAAAFRSALEGASDAAMMQPWTLLSGGKEIFTMPKVAVLRGMVLNHLVHHRGQLTVYLRLNDIPVPALYGPSADEGAM
jgi:uncharacterized damage-inducible protein DinB